MYLMLRWCVLLRLDINRQNDCEDDMSVCCGFVWVSFDGYTLTPSGHMW